MRDLIERLEGHCGLDEMQKAHGDSVSVGSVVKYNGKRAKVVDVERTGERRHTLRMPDGGTVKTVLAMDKRYGGKLTEGVNLSDLEAIADKVQSVSNSVAVLKDVQVSMPSARALERAGLIMVKDGRYGAQATMTNKGWKKLAELEESYSTESAGRGHMSGSDLSLRWPAGALSDADKAMEKLYRDLSRFQKDHGKSMSAESRKAVGRALDAMVTLNALLKSAEASFYSK